VTELNTHVGDTHKHIELLTAENRLLRDQLVYLYNVMRQNLSLTTPSPLSPTSSSSPYTPSTLPSSVPPSPSIPPTPPPSPISPFSSGISLPANNGMPSTLSSPSQMLDLSMLGFKGYNMMNDGTIYEMMKTQSIPAQNMPQNIPQHIPQNINQNINQAMNQNINQSMNQNMNQNNMNQNMNQNNMNQNMNQNMSQNLSQNLTQSITQNLAQNLQTLQNIQNMSQPGQHHMQHMTLAGTPNSSAQNSPVPTPTSSPSHLSNIPDLGTLKLDMDNAMLLSRYSKASDLNEAQTVPVFVKSEGNASL
jgi:hypothetical protein